MTRLAGKVAIVTGAGQGIGRGVARALGRQGAAVVLAGRTKEKVVAAAAEMKAESMTALAVQCDVTVPDDVASTVALAVENFGAVDILVNNAAIGYGEGDPSTWPAMEAITAEYFRSVQDTNVLGTLFFMQACFPHMKEAGGKIINFATGATGDPRLGAYIASKEAVRGLTKVAAREWGRYKINVNMIAPFALSPSLEALRSKRPEQFQAWVDRIPLGYAGDCEHDIGPVAVFLASDDSRYMTGNVLTVDGGMAGKAEKAGKQPGEERVAR